MEFADMQSVNSNSGLTYEPSMVGGVQSGQAGGNPYGAHSAYGPGVVPPGYSPPGAAPVTLAQMAKQPVSLSNPPSPQTKGDWIVMNDLVGAFSAKDPQAQINGMIKAATDAVGLLPPQAQSAYVKYLQKSANSNAVPNIQRLNQYLIAAISQAQKKGADVQIGPFTLWYLDLFTMITSKGGRQAMTGQSEGAGAAKGGMQGLPTESPTFGATASFMGQNSQALQSQANATNQAALQAGQNQQQLQAQAAQLQAQSQMNSAAAQQLAPPYGYNNNTVVA